MPNISASNSSAGIAAQLTGTKGPAGRVEDAWNRLEKFPLARRLVDRLVEQAPCRSAWSGGSVEDEGQVVAVGRTSKNEVWKPET
jgi:hypothetical protein